MADAVVHDPRRKFGVVSLVCPIGGYLPRVTHLGRSALAPFVEHRPPRTA